MALSLLETGNLASTIGVCVHVSALAMLGCDVVTTDQKEVLPLLKRNVEWNTSTILQMTPGSGLCQYCLLQVASSLLLLLESGIYSFLHFVMPSKICTINSQCEAYFIELLENIELLQLLSNEVVIPCSIIWIAPSCRT